MGTTEFIQKQATTEPLWVWTNNPLNSSAICDPDQDAVKHFRTKEEAYSKHRMWGVEKHWPRHKLALSIDTQLVLWAGWQNQTYAKSLQHIG